jgi:hypothetical protein
MISKALILLTVLLAVPFSTPQKNIFIRTGFLNGSDFLDMKQNEKVRFVDGFWDGVLVAPMFEARDDNDNFVFLRSCTDGMSDVQIAAIIEKYLKDHPEVWHLQLNMNAYNALTLACRH